MENNTIDLSNTLYDKKPITYLIRELQAQLDKGNDYVELTTENDFGNTIQILLFTKS